MLQLTTEQGQPALERERLTRLPGKKVINQSRKESLALATAITRAASKQTYSTIRFLVDHERTADAYRAYAYFRWLDDHLDEGRLERSDRLAFVSRQQTLIKRAYQGEGLGDVTAEESMLVHLIQGNQRQDSGLQTYICNMMAVMAFDAERRGRLISQAELDDYSRWLATAVTEALHYFIGHDSPSPNSQARYLAATAAHITHMLRDTLEDNAAGYYNIPHEWLEAQKITPQDITSEAYRLWVQSRVRLARAQFRAGKAYLAQVQNLRCRLAGYAYIARFAGVLDAIEKADYSLHCEYPKGKGFASGLKMCLGVR